MQDVFQWSPPPHIERGVIVGCTQSQEWLLPWWWMHFRMHNECPVTFFDFGDMTPLAKKWCQKRGNFKTLPSEIEGITASKEKIPVEQAEEWGIRDTLWEARDSWFKKPFVCLNSPYKHSLWIDLDCQVRKSIEPLFPFASNPQGCAIALNGKYWEKEMQYNSGVLVFNQGSPVIEEWAKLCVEMSCTVRGDQEIFWFMHSERNIQLPELPQRLHLIVEFLADTSTFRVRSQTLSPKDATILHWVGLGKNFIRSEINYLTEKAFMNFSLES